MRSYLNLSPKLTTYQPYCKNRAIVLQMLLNKQANSTLPAARKWEAVVVERLTNSTLQEHKQAAENYQVGCVPIRQSAAGAVTVKTDHRLSRHPIFYNVYDMCRETESLLMLNMNPWCCYALLICMQLMCL